MADDSVSATTVIAPAEAIFAVLADPGEHAAIDGTGWVGETLDHTQLAGAGQIFRMSMYHPNHPDGAYQMANRIQVFDPPNTISWEPGYDADDGTLRFGGWSVGAPTPTGSASRKTSSGCESAEGCGWSSRRRPRPRRSGSSARQL